MPAPFRSYGLLKGAAIVVVILLVTGPAVFLPTTPSQADIGVDAIVATTNQSCDPGTWNHTVTTGGSDRILVVGIVFDNTNGETNPGGDLRWNCLDQGAQRYCRESR